MQKYDSEFFKILRESSYRSAKEIVPIIINLLNPKSIADVGCGEGSFLSVFREYGVKNILGIDGKWINKNDLQIPKKYLFFHDLNKPLPKNFFKRKFDLVVSLEVAEHLAPESAENFVKTLVSLGNIILFSAAIPFQRGLNHLNEQWPNYWQDIFLKHNYIAFDCLRNKIWENKNIDWWYRQNLILFLNKDYLKKHRNLEKKLSRSISAGAMSLVHPEKYTLLEKENNNLRKWAENLQNDNKELYMKLVQTSSHLNEILNLNYYKLIFLIDSKLKKTSFYNFYNKLLEFLTKLRK